MNDLNHQASCISLWYFITKSPVTQVSPFDGGFLGIQPQISGVSQCADRTQGQISNCQPRNKHLYLLHLWHPSHSSSLTLLKREAEGRRGEYREQLEWPKKKNSWKELKKIQNDQKLVEMSLSQLKCYCKLWCFFFKCGHCFAFFLTPFLKDFIPSGATRPSWTGRSRRETRSRTMSMGLRVLRLKLTAWQALTRYAELTLPGQLGQQQN